MAANQFTKRSQLEPRGPMEVELRQSFCKAKPIKRTRREEDDDFDVNGETLDPNSLAYRTLNGSQPVYKKEPVGTPRADGSRATAKLL